MALHRFRPARRRLLQIVPVVLFLPAAQPRAQAKRVEETESQAQALGYKHDATKVDKAKFKNYQPGQTCEGCNFFKGKPGAAFGPCDIFGGREVSAKGWCSAWVKKS